MTDIMHIIHESKKTGQKRTFIPPCLFVILFSSYILYILSVSLTSSAPGR